MKRVPLASLLLFLLLSVGGCEQDDGVVATEDEIKAHVEKYGNQGLDPEADLNKPDTGFE